MNLSRTIRKNHQNASLKIKKSKKTKAKTVICGSVVACFVIWEHEIYTVVNHILVAFPSCCMFCDLGPSTLLQNMETQSRS